MLPLDTVGYHAGISSYHGVKNCNDFSIGIELPGPYDKPIPDEIMDKLYILIEKILSHCPITDVCAHRHLAPNRRKDPNTGFDFVKLANHFNLKFDFT